MPSKAEGRAVLLQGRDGTSYLFMSLVWGQGREQREQEMGLMIGSLRLLLRAKETALP